MEPPSQSLKVPAALRERVDAPMGRIEPFCASHLNNEYRQLIQIALAALARKRPSPLITGREPSWCAGVVHAIGDANFLFDPSQNPHSKPGKIDAYCGVSAGTGQAHSKKVRELLRIRPFSPHWTLPSKLDASTMVWMLEVDGSIRDIRTLPLAVQMGACSRGLILYGPALRKRLKTKECPGEE
jgi:hypothetical protein